MTKVDTYPSETMHLLKKRPENSDAHYERSKNDPLEFVFVDSKRGDLMDADLRGLEDATNRRDHGEVVEFASDLAYLSFLEDTGDVAKYTERCIKAILEKLQDRTLSPAGRLVLRSKILDMGSLQIFDVYHSANSSKDMNAKKSAEAALEASSKQTIIEGTKILTEMHRSLLELRKGTKEWEQEAADDLVGRMFELLYVTNRRRQIYGAGVHDESLILGVTEFQDCPALQFVPNHNFDFMEVAADGRITSIVQCKARDRGEVYDDSIKPVSGRGMRDFLDDPLPYIESIQLAISDQDDPRYEPLMISAIEKVDSLFITNYKDAGSAATRSLVTV